MSILEILGSAMMAVGALLSILAAIGVVDFPSTISRMHAATKSASLGLSLVAIGAGVAAASLELVGVGILIAAFLFVTAPIGGHMVGRAAYLAGWSGPLVHDDLAGAEVQTPSARITRRERFRPGRWALLVVVWMLLWRNVSIGTLVGGSIAATVVEWLRVSHPTRATLHPLGLARYLVRYAGLVVESNLRVAWEVITPTNESIVEAIVAVPLRTRSMNVALFVANAVTFTPGTLTVELDSDPMTIYAHVLHFSSAEEVRDTISELETHVIRAFGGDEPDESRDPSQSSRES